MNILDLGGCAPTPLAHYLKALGIFRLVSEQADPKARGWWEGERFRLASVLNRAALEDFFLHRYEPMPIVSPWNRGSGFYDNDPILGLVENSTAGRFEKLRVAICASRELLDDMVRADAAVRLIKAETKAKHLTKQARERLRKNEEYKKKLNGAESRFKEAKGSLIPRCRLAWRGPHRGWMDAAMVLDDKCEPKYPALLGTGGCDGRLDFTNNFMQRLVDIFDLSSDDGKPRESARSWIAGAIWGDPHPGCQAGSAVGMYLPGMAGGANSSNGPSGDSLLNPVDFLLMMEGTVLFVANATRRLGASEPSRAAAPFAVGAQGAGYASASGMDESARGEQWMPLWSQPLTLKELRCLLAEGRAQVGTRSAQDPLDLARAVARLGTSRGIPEFQRFGYIERNGQSNLAVPLGRFRVPERVSPKLACLDDLDAWLRRRLRPLARDKGAPARLILAERRLADALFAVVQHPDEQFRWQSVLLALADVEAVLRIGSGHKAGPIPRLRPGWVEAADDGSTGFRLALACAMQAADFNRDGIPYDHVRRHWLPLDGDRFATTGSGGQARLEIRPEVVLSGRRGLDDAIALVRRRLVEAAQRGERRLPLSAGRGAVAHPADLGILLAGEVDLDRTMQIARALMAVDGRHWASYPRLPAQDHLSEWPDDAWMAIRLTMLPRSLPDGRTIGIDPAIFRRLESGDAASAAEVALQRLRVAGVNTSIRAAIVSAEAARLWAAALAFPISLRTAIVFATRLDPNINTK